jgi:large subunit ribosomal protein L28
LAKLRGFTRKSYKGFQANLFEFSACFAHEEEQMAAYCQVTETKPQFGHAVSHAQNKTKRRFNPNIQKKTYFVPSLKRNVTLQLSARGIKVIDARGIESVVSEILARGEKI